jgi:hypothetical protein
MSDESQILRLVPPPPSPEEAKRAAGIRETLLFAEMVGLKIDEAQAIEAYERNEHVRTDTQPRRPGLLRRVVRALTGGQQ